MSWLPRVFPATTRPDEQERYELRHKLTELDRVPHVDNAGTEVEETEGDERPIPNPIHAPPSSTDSEMAFWFGSSSQTNDESIPPGIFHRLLLGLAFMCFLALTLYCAILLNLFYYNAVVCHDGSCAVDQHQTNLTFSCSTATDVLHSSENESVETYAILEDLTLNLESDQVSVEISDGSLETVEPGEIRTEPADDPPGETNTKSEAESIAASELSLRDKIDYWLGWTGPDPDA
ncbi:hypothetical protein BDW42DRAFT_161210 [Aspergillus taichungensis]|uniref:Uncharacterized protein n=1 Tax=Aspergillus taichungensis TaxID=482145 RepID=A0A2J5I5X9_9EURO|nr:hypothetical protein BDW42DRAFT_161210 [Aspergillus taichungensis]